MHRMGIGWIAAVGIVCLALVIPAAPAAGAAVGARQSAWQDSLCATSVGSLPTLRPSSTPTRSAAARVVQAALIYLDFPPPVPIKVDGWYGPATAAAVSAYQRSRGLAVDGVVGQQTWSQLRKEICGTATSSSDTGSTRPTTTITLKVSGCEGCTMGPATVRQTRAGEQPYLQWTGPRLTVTGGQATFDIPTSYTRGMSIAISAPWERGPGDWGAVPLVALSKGVPNAGDPTYIEGQHCWAGTTARDTVLSITVKRARLEGIGGKVTVPMAYLTSLGPPSSIPGHQDLPYCRVPR